MIETPTRFDALTSHDSDELGTEAEWLLRRRKEGLAWLDANGLPVRQDEPWHYFPTTRVSGIFSEATRPLSARSLDPRQVDIMAGDLGCPRLVFVNGVHDAGASSLDLPAGVTASSLVTAPDLGHGADHEGSPLPRSAFRPTRTDGTVALNAAATVDGASISVASGTDARTIHVVHVVVPDADKTYAVFPYTRVLLGDGAAATVIETFIGFGGRAVVDAATEIHLGSRARLAYHRVQSEGRSTIHLGRVDAVLDGCATLTASSVSLGGEIARTAFDVILTGDDSTVELNGLYLPRDDQHLDHTLTVQHSGDRTTSTQRFKGVMAGAGRGSFTGHVIVDPDTVGTTAHQTNHNILLTSRAEADTRPWLEILADDVRCTHGATVGRLDHEALFYLRSRGIPETTAREILIDAFASEIIEAIGPEGLREHLAARIAASRNRSVPAVEESQ